MRGRPPELSEGYMLALLPPELVEGARELMLALLPPEEVGEHGPEAEGQDLPRGQVR